MSNLVEQWLSLTGENQSTLWSLTESLRGNTILDTYHGAWKFSFLDKLIYLWLLVKQVSKLKYSIHAR